MNETCEKCAPHRAHESTCTPCVMRLGPCYSPDHRVSLPDNGDVDPDVARDRRNSGRDPRTGFRL